MYCGMVCVLCSVLEPRVEPGMVPCVKMGTVFRWLVVELAPCLLNPLQAGRCLRRSPLLEAFYYRETCESCFREYNIGGPAPHHHLL
jgi:hypothetical protein